MPPLQARRENYGKGEVELDLLDRQALLERLLTTLRSPGYTPPLFPATALELLALSRRPGVQFDQISKLLEKDPIVAARVLKVAQSAHFSRGARVMSLHDAVVRLGLETVANVFLEVSMNMRVFRAPGFDAPMEELRRHSALVAHVARALCRRTSVFDEYAFLCGLLHDVGIAVSAAVIGRDIPFEEGWPVILEAHAEAGRLLCVQWKLPPDVALVVGAHHAPKIGGMAHPVACAVAIADWIATELGVGTFGEEASLRPTMEIQVLDLTESAIAEVIADAKRAVERLTE